MIGARRGKWEKNMQNVGVLIVAAGMSSRMGRFKPLLPLGKDTLISYTLNKFIAFGMSPIVIVTGNEAKRLESYIEEYKRQTSQSGIVCIRNDRYETTEMFDTIKIGMRWLRGKCDSFFVLPADIPLIEEETIRALLSTECLVCKPMYHGHGGHPLYVRAELIDSILKYSGENGLKGAFQKMDIHVQPVEVEDEGILLDADTMEDYQHIKRIWEQKRMRKEF